MKKATDEQLDEAGKLARKLSCEQFPYLFIFCHCMHSISHTVDTPTPYCFAKGPQAVASADSFSPWRDSCRIP